jgi:hypothetical protein
MVNFDEDRIDGDLRGWSTAIAYGACRNPLSTASRTMYELGSCTRSLSSNRRAPAQIDFDTGLSVDLNVLPGQHAARFDRLLDGQRVVADR